MPEEPKPTRRGFLGHIAGAYVAAAAASGTAVAVSEISRLWPHWQNARAEHGRALAAIEAANEQFEARQPSRPKEAYIHPLFGGPGISWLPEHQGGGVIRHYGGSAQWREVAERAKDERVRKEANRRLAIVKAYEAEMARQETLLGIPELEAVYDKAWADLRSIEEAISALPASSLADLMKKVAIARRNEVEVRQILDVEANRWTLNVFAEIERLAAA